MYNDEPIPEQDDRPQADYVVELWYEMQEQQIASHEAWWQMLDKDESWINSNDEDIISADEDIRSSPT